MTKRESDVEMNLQRKITEIFQNHYPDLVEKIEKEVYLFLEEMLIQKNIDLNETISYKDPNFQDSLLNIVNTIGVGLSSIGVPKDQIEIHLKNQYRFFKADENLLNYSDWIHKEFKDKIDFLLLSEILKFFTDKENNIINKMIDFSLISEKIKERFNEIEKNNPKLFKYLSWQKITEDKLIDIVFNSGKLESLYNFADPERDLLILYDIYVLGKIFGFEWRINLSPAVPFLISDVEKWSSKNKNISLIHPATLYAGLYLAENNDIDIDKSICQKHVKKMLIDAVNSNKDPIFSLPYLLNDIIGIMGILGLKLTSNFTESITSKNENSTSKNNLKLKKTAELGLILLLYKQLDAYQKINDVERNNFLEIIKERSNDGSIFKDNISKTCNIESLTGGFTVLDENKSLTKENLNFEIFLDHLIDEINQLTANLTLDNPDNLGNLILGIRLIEKIDLSPDYLDSYIIKGLEKYIFSDILGKTKANSGKITDKSATLADVSPVELIFSDKSKSIKNTNEKSQNGLKFDDDFNFDFDFDLDSKQNRSVSDENQNKDKMQLDLFSGDTFSDDKFSGEEFSESPFLNEIVFPKNDIEVKSEKVSIPDDDFFNDLKSTSKNTESINPENIFSQSNEESLSNHSPNDIISFHIDMPNLSNQIIDNLQLNYQAITKPPTHIEDRLEKLYQLIMIEKLLKIKHHFDKTQIDNICKQKSFLKNNGFGEPDASNSDIVNTYYGLMIYNEYQMVERLDIYKIHDFLIYEIKFFNAFKIYENKFLFLCFKVLNKYGINLPDYTKIMEKIQATDYSIIDEYQPLLDTYDQIVALKVLSPQSNLESFDKENYLELVKSNIDNDGSINGIVSDTAIVLLTLGILDLLDREPEMCNKMTNFIANYGAFFSPALETTHITWGIDEFGYSLELQMMFWGLFAIGITNPAKSNSLNPHICPECGTFFKTLPKFCNICGFKFI